MQISKDEKGTLNRMKDFWTEGLQNHRKGKLKKLAVFIGFVVIAIIILILIMIYMYNLKFRRWCDENLLKREIYQKDTKMIELDGDENAQIYAYDKYICILRKKTLEFYNKMGSKVETIDIDINKAMFTSQGRYMAIAEENGQKFYLICGKEKLFENEIDGNISHVNVSKSGYISIVISNASYKSIIGVYNKKGTEVFKKNLVLSRVADVSISQDGKYLAIAEIDVSGILIQSRIQVVSIESAQTKPDEAVLYKYEAPIDKLILNIEYQEMGKIICMYNDSIEVLQEDKNSKLVELKDKNISFVTVGLNNRIATLEEISTGDFTSDTKVNIINPITTKSRQYISKNVAKSIKTYENKIAINFGTELHIIGINGLLIKKYISETEINDIVLTDSLLGVVYRDKIQIINL